MTAEKPLSQRLGDRLYYYGTMTRSNSCGIERDEVKEILQLEETIKGLKIDLAAREAECDKLKPKADDWDRMQDDWLREKKRAESAEKEVARLTAELIEIQAQEKCISELFDAQALDCDALRDRAEVAESALREAQDSIKQLQSEVDTMKYREG